MIIERVDGERVEATYVKYIRTLTPPVSGGGSDNTELDLFRLADGREIICESETNDSRSVPREVEGMTREAAMFAE